MSLSLSIESSTCVFADFSVEQLFGKAENERISGIKNERRRQESLAGLVALQKAVGNATECEIQRDERGRPHFVRVVGIDFSISHSGSLSVAAVSEDHHRVGVDLELIRADRAFLNERIAERYFTEQEKKLLADSRSADDFYRIWTEKEAVAKLFGIGLSELISHGGKIDGAEGLAVYRFVLTHGGERYFLTLCSDVESKVEIINGEDVSVCFIEKF